MDKNYGVYAETEYSDGTKTKTLLAGLGRNRGTWDASHTKRTAQRHAAILRKANKEFPGFPELLTDFVPIVRYTVERTF